MIATFARTFAVTISSKMLRWPKRAVNLVYVSPYVASASKHRSLDINLLYVFRSQLISLHATNTAFFDTSMAIFKVCIQCKNETP